MKHAYYLIAAFLMLASLPARAEFALSEMIIDFADGAPRQRDIEVISKGKEVQYIATETYKVENPTEPNEKRTLVTDPVKSGLMITPNKMALAAGARKTVRFLVLAPQTDKDQIYRVAMKPVIQGIEENKQRVALKLLVGYEVLVIVRPKDAKVDLVAERKGNAFTLTNKGNTNAQLQGGQQCDTTGSNCKDINVTRMYAGRTWTTTLPYMDGPVKFQIWDGKSVTNVEY